MLSVNYGTKAKYNAIATKDNDALYFCTDTLELYKGSDAYSKAVKFVSTLPTGDAISPNVVYALADGTIKSWDPTAASGVGAWVTIGVPKTTSVAAAATASDDLIPTEKAVRTALDTDITNLHIENYAPLNSPALTGTPTAPTATTGDSSTQIATTAFVSGAISDLNITQYAPLASPSFTGTPTAPTAAESTNNTQIATTSFVHTVANSAEAAAKAASDPAGSASAAESAAKTYTDNKLAWVSFN